MSKKILAIVGVVILVIVLGVAGVGYFIYNDVNQKSCYVFEMDIEPVQGLYTADLMAEVFAESEDPELDFAALEATTEDGFSYKGVTSDGLTTVYIGDSGVKVEANEPIGWNTEAKQVFAGNVGGLLGGAAFAEDVPESLYNPEIEGIADAINNNSDYQNTIENFDLSLTSTCQ
jgi:hypothetical protein